MSQRLALQKCWNHTEREAVARCPECTRFFCRECVVEHGHRILCSACLGKLLDAHPPKKRALGLAPIWRFAATFAGFIVAWLAFFWLGRALLEIPDETHAVRFLQNRLQEAVEEGMEE
jgi:hypothetical protein